MLQKKAVTNAVGLSPLPFDKRYMKVQGESFVLSSGQVFRKSQITPEYIYQLKKKNSYFKGTLIKQKNLIFRKQVVIEAIDAKGKRDDRVTAKLKKRFLSSRYNLWNAMRQAFDDTFSYGISIFNPCAEWQQIEGALEYYPTELRHLPTRTFESGGMIAGSTKQQIGTKNVYTSDMFGGIQFNIDTKQVEYYQTFENETKQLTNIIAIKDPSSEEFGGEPLSYPIIPIIEMLKYAWKGEMQTVNRIGAPVIMIKVTNPREADPTNGAISDEEYASTIIKNWGKDTAFVLRDNMELINMPITEGTVTQSVIDTLTSMIIDYFSPASSISGGGALFGGSNAPELDLVNAYINGIHDWLEAAFQPLVQEWLDINRYDGYTAVVTIPEPEADMTTANIQKALAGHNTQALTTNEKRVLLDEEELDEAGLKQLKEEYAVPAAEPGGFSYKPGELKALQNKGVTQASANSFRAERPIWIDGRLDSTVQPVTQKNVTDGDPTGWITINGQHIPLYGKETPGDAIKRMWGGKTLKVSEVKAFTEYSSEHSDKMAKSASAKLLSKSPQAGQYGIDATGSVPVLKEYTQHRYEVINGLLREDVSEDIVKEALSKYDIRFEYQQGVKDIDGVIDNAPEIPKGTTAYRGLGVKSGEALANKNIGDLCSDKAFQSYSLNPSIADHFTNAWGNDPLEPQYTVIRAIMNGKVKGVYIPESASGEEHEILVARGTKWKIVGKETLNGKFERTYHIVTVTPV